MEQSLLLSFFKKAGVPIVQKQYGKAVAYLLGEKAVLAIGGHGKVQFGIRTQYFLSEISDVDQVICAGVGGGLVSDVHIGDVVLGRGCVEHDYQQKLRTAPSPFFEGNVDMLKVFEGFESSDYDVHVGVIASGDEDILDEGRRKELQSQTGAIAVAWEGAGGARACKFNRKPYLEIRAISDTCRGGDFEKGFNLALENLGRFLMNIVK